MALAKEIKPGFFLSVYEKEVPEDIISIAADEMLRIEGRKATFVIAQLPGKKELKMSSRGIDTNVQIIAEAVGGGGHFSSSAATSKEPIKVFSDNLIHSIVSEKERIK
jgi:c-di-AMP phosphodiesterase-like protein